MAYDCEVAWLACLSVVYMVVVVICVVVAIRGLVTGERSIFASVPYLALALGRAVRPGCRSGNHRYRGALRRNILASDKQMSVYAVNS
jgi:hypothetical protein